MLRPTFYKAGELGRAGELEGRVGRGYRGVTTRSSQRDIVLHTALLFYASGRPSFLCISSSFPASYHFIQHIFVSLFSSHPRLKGWGEGYGASTPRCLLLHSVAPPSPFTVRASVPSSLLISFSTLACRFNTFSFHFFRHTLDSRAGGRGTAPQHPVASFCIASRCHPRLPCA